MFVNNAEIRKKITKIKFWFMRKKSSVSSWSWTHEPLHSCTYILMAICRVRCATNHATGFHVFWNVLLSWSVVSRQHASCCNKYWIILAKCSDSCSTCLLQCNRPSFGHGFMVKPGRLSIFSCPIFIQFLFYKLQMPYSAYIVQI